MPLNSCASYELKRSSWIDHVKITPNRYFDNFSTYLNNQENSVNRQLKRSDSYYRQSVVYKDDSDFLVGSLSNPSRMTSRHQSGK